MSQTPNPETQSRQPPSLRIFHWINGLLLLLSTASFGVAVTINKSVPALIVSLILIVALLIRVFVQACIFKKRMQRYQIDNAPIGSFVDLSSAYWNPAFFPRTDDESVPDDLDGSSEGANYIVSGLLHNCSANHLTDATHEI